MIITNQLTLTDKRQSLTVNSRKYKTISDAKQPGPLLFAQNDL